MEPRILWVAKSYTMPHAGVKPHSHPYSHLILIVAGTCQMTVNKKVYDLAAGETVLIPPQTEHSYTNENEIPMQYLEIKFVTEKTPAFVVSQDPLVADLFKRVVEEYPERGSLADRSAAAYLTALLYAVAPKEKDEAARRFQYVDATGCNEMTQQVIGYLESHYREDLRLDDIAQAMDYNKSYLCVAFKKDAGFTILDCLNTIRVRRAAELIVYSDHSLQQVAELCGFASVSHFNRVFLKYVGNTPGQCRRAYPVDVLFERKQPEPGDRPGRFMYSALAHRTITPEMIQELDVLEKSQEEK